MDVSVSTRLRRHAFPAVFVLCAVATVLPLWVVRHLPSVDVPQHLFLVHVLGHLDDPALPYAQIFEARPGLTYLTFYYSTRWLSTWVGVEAALQIWLTAVVALIPLSVLALLRAFGRNRWLSLLAFPLAYTDNFYWGLVSFLSSVPPTLLTLACFALALSADARTRTSRLALAGTLVGLVALQLTHGAGMIFPALALPVILGTTPSDLGRRLRAMAALVPGVALFAAWLLVGVGRGRQLGAAGEPWKATAPLFDQRNFVFHPLRERLARLFDLLANGFWDWADRPALWLLAGLAALATAFALAHAIRTPDRARAGALARLRPALLLALALGCYFALPADITGYMYYVYFRYAQLAALLAIPVLALPDGLPTRVFAPAAAAVALYAGMNLAVLFRRFDVEAQNFERVAKGLAPGARVLHMVLDQGSRVATHAVYLHYPALAALRSGGVPSFSLATDPSYPVGYRDGARPPAPPWEWRPLEVNWATQAPWYDHILYRSAAPAESVLGSRLADFELAGRADLWRLFRRRATGGGPGPLLERPPSQ